VTPRPVRIELRGFRGWTEGAFELDRDLTVIVGPNGCGKSSAVNALEWCLFGRDAELKASGIDERADWEVAHLDERGVAGDVEVRLALETGEGTARLVRRRPAGAKPRDEDDFSVELPDESVLRGVEAVQWMGAAGLPEWGTWRRALCQHQETARARLTASGDRSTLLASLLGLETHESAREVLEGCKPGALVKEIDEEVGALERDLLARLARPAEEQEECERGLAALDLERERLRPTLALELARGLLERARALGAELGFAPELPDCESEHELPRVADWVARWPERAREAARVDARLRRASGLRAKLDAADQAVGPAEERWRQARDRAAGEVRARGDVATQERLLSEARKARDEAEAALRRDDAARALVRDAREVLRHAHDPEACPVCAARAPGLAARLEAELAAGGEQRHAALEDDCGERGARVEELERGLRATRELVQAEADARASLDRAHGALSEFLPAGHAASGRDPLAAARAELERLERDVRDLERGRRVLDDALRAHHADAERLRAVQRWREAVLRAERSADPTSSPAWRELQAALDAAAAFAADLEALGGMAREAQERASEEREREVNERLGDHYGRITGDEGAAGVRVRGKRTPKGLTFDLEDARGKRVLATLNQAALNSVSLALLLAQAEERARAGRAAFVVLDEPGQSLDDEHQAGLARAIEHLAAICPVIVATPPGALAERLVEGREPSRRVLKLAPRDPGEPRRGARIESREER